MTTTLSPHPVTDILAGPYNTKTLQFDLFPISPWACFPGNYLYVTIDGKPVKGSYAPSGLPSANGFSLLP